MYVYIYTYLILQSRVGDKIDLIKKYRKSCSIYCQYALAQEPNKTNKTLYTVHYVCSHAITSAKAYDG